MNVSQPNLHSLTPSLVNLAEKAGRLICRIYQEKIEVFEKKDGSPVTRADHQSHDLLQEGLTELTPLIPLISEEDANSWRIKSPLYWLVDPLDGTKGFIHKNGQFCINIALMEHDHPVFGLIHIPVTQETFYGYAGSAWRHIQGKSEPIHTRLAPAHGMTLLLGGYGTKFKEQEDVFLKGYPISKITRIQSAIKFCTIASGAADLYLRFEACSEWDTAAGQALVEAAGGTMANIDGSPFVYSKPGLLNKAFVVFGHKP